MTDASCASLVVLLRHVYTGATTSALSPQSHVPAAGTAAGAPASAPVEAKGERRTDGRAEAAAGASREEGASAEVAAWRRLALQAAEANATLASGEQLRGTVVEAMGAGSTLPAATVLEILLLARRYLLPTLAGVASTRLEGVLRPIDVVPLLLQAQQECEEDAVQQIADWAVSHFEDVSAQIDSWLGTNLLTAPLAVRRLGEEQLAELREQLRVEMLRERYGL